MIPDSGLLFRRLEAAGWPMFWSSGRPIGGSEEGWSLVLPRLMPAELEDVARQLPEIEARVARHNALMQELDSEAAERRERDRAFRRAELRDLLR
jgi:hypothetical protein